MKELKVYLINVFLCVAVVFVIVNALPETQFGAIELLLLLFLVFFVLWSLSWFYSKSHFNKVFKTVALAWYFIKELILASLKVAYDIITPDFLLKPGIVAFPLSAKSDLEITLLANMVSLTPGTLSMSISEDRKILYIHSLYVTDGKESVINEIKNGFERRILEITR